MMFTKSACLLFSVASSLVAASPAPTAACWPGSNIHDSCQGFKTGCTQDGFLVACQESTDAMIFSSSCGSEAPRSCAYDADCHASCAS
ncbi:hypothetical protein F4779DRAFT_569332 [Xylariaceae sp. FL0662B]|nr:hypothetical protein F4779DRAFT_569332 [Xylariaceae sp. FL0662B]